MTHEHKWLRLDNSAKIFPLIMYKDNQNLFRISIELKEDIIKEHLQKALDFTLPRFPSLKVKLMKGLFWYYFEENNLPCIVYEESDIIMKKITPYNCNGYCFRITYYNNRITCEFYHVLCDGQGAIQFLKSLLYSYLSLCGKKVDAENDILTLMTPISPREVEDSFIKNYKKTKLKDTNFKNLTGKSLAFNIEGTAFNQGGKGVISCDLSAKKLHSYCKERGYTITEFLGGLFMYSIYKTKAIHSQKRDDIILFIPINLRKIYNSITLRNFTLFSRVGADISNDNLELNYFIKIMQENLKTATKKELLDTKINAAVLAEKIWVMRILPLFIKKSIFHLTNFLGRKKPTKTATFSNIGIVNLPKDMAQYVDKFSFMLHTYSTIPEALTTITVNDTMTISFCRSIMDNEIEKFFMRYLASIDMDLVVSSNYWEVENAL